MSELKERLEEILSRPVESAEDQEVAEDAARLLVQLVKVEGGARRLLDAQESRRRSAGTAQAFDGLSLHEAARRVLEQGGWPMHVRDLGVRIKAGGWRHPRSKHARPDQISFQLAARLPKYPSVFRRVAPNTFALVVWGDSPPRPERPKPRFGLFGGPGGNLSEWIGEHPEAPFEDEDNA